MHHGYVSVYTYLVFDEQLDVGRLKDYKANIEDDFNNYIGLILDALIRAPETMLKILR